MELDKNPFPKIDLFPRLSKLAHFILDRHEDVEARGGGPRLDEHLYGEVAVHGFLYEGEQLEFPE